VRGRGGVGVSGVREQQSGATARGQRSRGDGQGAAVRGRWGGVGEASGETEVRAEVRGSHGQWDSGDVRRGQGELWSEGEHQSLSVGITTLL
jgi:hypothetical protein